MTTKRASEHRMLNGPSQRVMSYLGVDEQVQQYVLNDLKIGAFSLLWMSLGLFETSSIRPDPV